jgi:hypothetical protein
MPLALWRAAVRPQPPTRLIQAFQALAKALGAGLCGAGGLVNTCRSQANTASKAWNYPHCYGGVKLSSIAIKNMVYQPNRFISASSWQRPAFPAQGGVLEVGCTMLHDSHQACGVGVESAVKVSHVDHARQRDHSPKAMFNIKLRNKRKTTPCRRRASSKTSARPLNASIKLGL